MLLFVQGLAFGRAVAARHKCRVPKRKLTLRQVIRIKIQRCQRCSEEP